MGGYQGAADGLDAIIEILEMRYAYDANGRLADVQGDGILPRFVLGRAPEGCLWRFRADLEKERVNSIARLAGREPGFPIAGKKPVPPPERLVMIERLLAEDGVDVDTRHEVMTRDGVDIAEIWTIG